MSDLFAKRLALVNMSQARRPRRQCKYSMELTVLALTIAWVAGVFVGLALCGELP